MNSKQNNINILDKEFKSPINNINWF
jgi:hypothetical protein